MQKHTFKVGDIIGTTTGSFAGIWGKVVVCDYSKSTYKGKVKHHPRYQIEAWYKDTKGNYNRVKAGSSCTRDVHIAESNCTKILGMDTIDRIIPQPDMTKFVVLREQEEFPYPDMFETILQDMPAVKYVVPVHIPTNRFFEFDGKLVSATDDNIRGYIKKYRLESIEIFEKNVTQVVQSFDLI